VTLRVYSWDGGPPDVLLLHGIGNYGRYWDLFADAVAGRLRLVAPDARGHGDSGKPADGYTVDEFVADAVAILDAYGVERTLLVGHSMGGSHAIALAGVHPERVLGLVVVDNSPEPLPEGSERARRLSLQRPERFASAAEAEAYLRRTSPGYSDAVYANRLRWLFDDRNGALTWQSSANALRRILEARRGVDDVWAAWRAVRCPTLIVHGTRSNVLSVTVARRMAAERRETSLLHLETGHNVALEQPLELADAVVEFARNLPARRVL
jgi:pimeloyl-ACP methyl ester carboxylesterase